MRNFWRQAQAKFGKNQNLQAILLLIFWTFGSRALGFIRSFLVIQMSAVDAEIFNSSFVLSEAITSFFILGSITVAILPQMIKLENPGATAGQDKPKNDQSKTSDFNSIHQLNENTAFEATEPESFDPLTNTQTPPVKLSPNLVKTNFNTSSSHLSANTMKISSDLNLESKKPKITQIDISPKERRFVFPEIAPPESSAKSAAVGFDSTPENLQPKIDQEPSPEKDQNNFFKTKNTDPKESLATSTKDKLSIYTSWSLVILSGFILSLSVLGIIFIEPLLSIFNPSFFQKVDQVGKLSEMLWLNRLLLLAPFLFSIKTILGVFLNVKKDYRIYSLEGVLANLGWILALSIFYPIWGLIGASSGMFLGFGLTIMLFAWQTVQLGLNFNLGTFPELPNALWQTFHLYWPRLLIFSNTRLAEIIVAATSGNPSDPQITSVAMALNFQGIFIGVVLAIGTVFLPNLTEALVQKGRSPDFWHMLIKYIKVNFFLAIAGTIGTIVGVPILFWLLTRLPFVNSKGLLSDPVAVDLILQFSFISSFSLIFQSVGEILNRYFVAVERRWEPVIISIGGNFLAIQIALLFTKPWGAGAAAIGGFVLNSALFCCLSIFFCYQDWRQSQNSNLASDNLENVTES